MEFPILKTPGGYRCNYGDNQFCDVSVYRNGDEFSIWYKNGATIDDGVIDRPPAHGISNKAQLVKTVYGGTTVGAEDVALEILKKYAAHEIKVDMIFSQILD